ncbi:MAG: DUF3810 domain-containing protein [Lutibacter sp.]|nr:DUF3810 domain-containing protein [Lutibacter sp.]MDP3944453.1 DUF3810 domain-containing protein [Lutibacter sp.]
MDSKKTYKILTIILVMQWAFLQIIAQFPTEIEKYYSNGLYRYISKFLNMLFGWIPFSVGDILYAFLFIFILLNIFTAIKNKKIDLINTLFKIGGFISVLFFVFHLNWGLNYFRQPIYKTINFEIKKYSTNELIDFTEKLIVKINQVQLSITKNDTLIVNNGLSKPEIQEISYNVYDQFQEKYTQFPHKNLKVKHSLYSLPLTYMGFAGYLNPLTNEAQVNYLIPKNTYPMIVCHELAHQVGIASESEANFMGYLATTNSDNVYFNYSGYLMAVRFCLFEISQKDPAKFEALKIELNKGILKDIRQSEEFWESYQNWSEKYFKTFYDSFLKANKQKDGMKSYNKVVVLLVNYHKTNEL